MNTMFSAASIAPATALASPTLSLEAPAADRIFAAIERDKALRTMYDDWCDGNTPEALQYRAADKAAWNSLFSIRPTTIAGIKALAGYFREIAEGWRDDNAMQFLAAIEAACEHVAAA